MVQCLALLHCCEALHVHEVYVASIEKCVAILYQCSFVVKLVSGVVRFCFWCGGVLFLGLWGLFVGIKKGIQLCCEIWFPLL